MLPPEEVSINTVNSESDPSAVTTRNQGERIPLLFRKKFFSRIFKYSSSSEPNGYVEFGAQIEDSGRTLGTFAGVFSPVALSMFSALLFLRVGFIVGNAGLYFTLLQFFIAYLILLFTVTSICAVSTNGAVEGGGAYFMISRTLGPEFGGSIGTLFFLANIVSSALYITGCVEGLIENFGPGGYLIGNNEQLVLKDGEWWRFFYCSILNLLNLLVCLIGSSMFAKTNVSILYIVCVSLMSSLLSFLLNDEKEIPIPSANTLVQNSTFHVNGTYTGWSYNTLHENLYSNYSKDYTSRSSANFKSIDFSAVFGVLFSGVTGIMAGANMSGELKEPSKNIPRGTLGAVFFTFVTYIIMSIFCASTTSRFLLQNNYAFLLPINSIWPPLIAIGILTATFSASLSNFIGSSRILEALAKDNVYGFILNFISSTVYRGNPIAAVILSFLFVELILLIGSLNLIAQVNSVLFLLSYLATNLACLGLELASAPNFRPTFKYFTWHTAFLGMVSTLIMMFVINPLYAGSSIILCFILFIFLHLLSPSRKYQWGSISQALIFHQVRKYLLLLDARKDHVKFWRPQILLLVNNPRTCCPLISFVNDIKKGGLYVLGHVHSGHDFLQLEEDSTIDEYPYWLSLVDHLKVKAFVELTVAETVREGFHHLVRISGMGAMKPNTIFLGFYDEEIPIDFFGTENPYHTDMFKETDAFTLRDHDRKNMSDEEYAGIVSDTFKMKKNLCICRYFQNLDKVQMSKKSKTERFIDVWPINFFKPDSDDPFDTTSLFMFQLACILNMVPGWNNLHLRVFLCDHMSERLVVNEIRLKLLLQSLRIVATINKVPGWNTCHSLLLGGNVCSKVSTENCNKSYLLRVNELIRSYSEKSSCLFLYLPPQFTHPEEEESPTSGTCYLRYLIELTADLPPTVLVHGVHGVTSTTL